MFSSSHRAGSRRTRLLASAIAIGGAFLATLGTSPEAAAQGYPNRPITLITPFSAGGDADLAARNFAAAAQRALGQTVIVMNKVGASGVIGSTQAIQSQPDGYTLLLARTGSQAILPAIQPTSTKYKWDDYTFIGTLEQNPYGCVVNAKSPYMTFGDLVTAMRTKGKNLNYGTAGILTTNDMGPRQLFKMLKLTDQTPTQIPYKGTGEASMSLMAGETEFSCGSLGSFIQLIKAGSLRALMVTSPERMSTFPDVPTARELGFADMEGIVGWSALYGPPKMPVEIRDRLFTALKAISADPAWIAATAQTGSTPSIRDPKETKEFAERQYHLYRSLGESMNLIDSKM